MSCLSKEDKKYFEDIIKNTREQTRRETWDFIGNMIGIDPSNVEDCRNLRDNYNWLNKTRTISNKVSTVAITTAVSACVMGFVYGIWEFIKIVTRRA